MNNEIDKTYCFTGHRERFWKKQSTIDNINYEQLIITKITNTVKDLYSKGITNFIVGGASGVDTYAAIAIMKLKEIYSNIKIILALPFDNFYVTEYKYQDHGIFNYKERFDQITNTSGEDQYCYTECLKSYNQWAIPLLFKRNIWMINNSCGLIAIYDLSSEKGGSLHAVKYARKQNKQIIVLDVLK